MTTDNEGVIRAFYDEFVNTGDRDAVLRLVDPDVMLHFGGQLVGTGPAAFQGTLAVLRTAFPDLYTTIEHVVVGGDVVCERVVTHGTHLGTLTLPALPPIVATGRTIQMHGISMFQLRDRKITANWAMPDQLGLLRQVGALDGLAQAARAGAAQHDGSDETDRALPLSASAPAPGRRLRSAVVQAEMTS